MRKVGANELRRASLLSLRDADNACLGLQDVDLGAHKTNVRCQLRGSGDGSGPIVGPIKNKKSLTIRLRMRGGRGGKVPTSPTRSVALRRQPSPHGPRSKRLGQPRTSETPRRVSASLGCNLTLRCSCPGLLRRVPRGKWVAVNRHRICAGAPALLRILSATRRN